MSGSNSWLVEAITWGVYPSSTGGGGGSVTEQQVQQFAFNYAPATGVDDAFIVVLNPAVTSLSNNLVVSMSSGTLQNLTSSPTLKVNALSPVPITLWGGLSLAPNDISPNTSYLFIYDLVGNTFQLINPSVSNANTFLVQENFYNSAIDTGSSNAFSITLIPAPQSSYGEGFPVYMRAGGGHTNTGASTLTVNGTTDPIVLQNGNALPANSILANGTYWFLWSTNLSSWVLMNPVPAPTSGGLAIATISGTTQTAVVNTKYYALNAAQTTISLPSTYAVGSVIAVIGSNANTGGWILQAAAGDTVRYLTEITTSGGTVTCPANAGSTVYIECDVANTSWIVTSTVSTSLTTA